ncbi:hypothetical protein [Variovorax sp. OV329]|uniref:hypothetical protein n=1 Tax=Variovorax sp. OV329 TaxID=1882825 RepID=UPI000B851E97|nr:hypothetical protein [Variovorax sp. OV329]
MNEEKRGRGRPRKDAVRDFMQPRSPQWVARAVFKAEAEFGLKRMQAVDLVLKNIGLPATDREKVKRYASRHSNLRDLVNTMDQAQRSAPVIGSAIRDTDVIRREVSRRMADFSDPVLKDAKGVLELSFFKLRKLLVAQKIDGNLPGWFIECVRANGNANGSELMRLLERAALEQS